MLNIAICESDKKDLDVIYNYTLEYLDTRKSKYRIFRYERPNTMLSRLSGNFYFDIVLCEMDFPDMSGIDIGLELRRYNNLCFIIFMHHTLKNAGLAFKLHAYQYLIKPIDKSILFKTYSDIRSLLYNHYYSKIQIKTDKGNTLFNYDDILWIEYDSFLRKSIVNFKGGESVQTAYSLTEIDTRLAPIKQFLRSHRAFIVNMNHAHHIQPYDFILDNGTAVPVAKNKYTSIRKEYFSYLDHRSYIQLK